MTSLTGHVAVVTGAASDIGRATAARLAADGAHVLAVDVDAGGVRETTRMIEEKDGIAAHHVADLADSTGRMSVVATAIERFGRVDVLVNNAAYHGPRVALLDLPDAEWERVIATNLTATAVLCREAGRDMVRRSSGVIVNIVAIQERLPLETYAAYAASKGGVSALTRALAAELSPRGVRVNAIAPGVIETLSLRASLGGPQVLDKKAPTLLGRAGSPEELAAAVAFLASDEASFVTGVVLPVDGGRSISRRPDPLAVTYDASTGNQEG